MRAKDVARYWTYVQIGTAEECWKWTGTYFDNGYGAFWLNGQNRGAHRIGYCLANRCELTSDVIVRHRCDNPCCQNPSHLLAGTQADNMMDMSERGRSLRGEKNPKAQLTGEAVAAIRARYALSNVSQQAIADEFGVDKATVGRVIRGETWVDAEAPDMSAVLEARKKGEAKAHRGEAAGNSVLTAENVVDIRRRFSAGETNKSALAREFGTDRTNIDCIVRRKTWTHIG